MKSTPQKDHTSPSSGASATPWAFYFLMGILVLSMLFVIGLAVF